MWQIAWWNLFCGFREKEGKPENKNLEKYLIYEAKISQCMFVHILKP